MCLGSMPNSRNMRFRTMSFGWILNIQMVSCQLCFEAHVLMTDMCVCRQAVLYVGLSSVS
jgi:hypothetical protein